MIGFIQDDNENNTQEFKDTIELINNLSVDEIEKVRQYCNIEYERKKFLNSIK